MKPPRIPKQLLKAVRANDPDQVRVHLQHEPTAPESFAVLLEEADRVGVGLVAGCHNEITSPDPDIVGSLANLGNQITSYLGIRALINERIPQCSRAAEHFLAVYSKRET